MIYVVVKNACSCKILLILSLLKQGLVFPNSSCLTSTDLSGHDNDTETGSEPLTGCLNLSLITQMRESVHELTPHTFNPCTAENSYLTWAVWELDVHTASIRITFSAWGDPDQMLWLTSCLLLSTIHFLSLDLPAKHFHFPANQEYIIRHCMWSVQYSSYLQCCTALPAACLCQQLFCRSSDISDSLLGDIYVRAVLKYFSMSI